MLKAISLKWLYIRLKTTHTHSHSLISTLTCGYKGIKHFAVAVAHIFYHTFINSGCRRRDYRCCHNRKHAHMWMNVVCWIKIFDGQNKIQQTKTEFYSFLLFILFHFFRVHIAHTTHILLWYILLLTGLKHFIILLPGQFDV